MASLQNEATQGLFVVFYHGGMWVCKEVIDPKE